MMHSYRKGDPVDVYFNTRDSGGNAITLGGSPSLAAYLGASNTPITAGITLNVNHHGTGAHHARIDTSNAAYSDKQSFVVRVAAGTVDGQSVVGEKLFEFTLGLGYVEADVTEWDANTVEDSLIPGVPSVSTRYVNSVEVFATDGTAQSGGESHVILSSDEPATDGYYDGQSLTIVSGTGAGQSRLISEYIGSTRRANVATAWAIEPSVDSEYLIGPTGASATATIHHCPMVLRRDGSTYRLRGVWKINGRDIDGGLITDPTYEIRNGADHSIVASGSLTQNGNVVRNEGITGLNARLAYTGIMRATIDGQSREWKQPLVAT
jgi:hypothetical protein